MTDTNGAPSTGEDRLHGLPMPPCARLLGWRHIAHDREGGWIRVGFDGRADFANPAGLIQGGLLAAMLDDTMGPAVWVATDGRLYTATIDMTISFLAPARPGPLEGEGRVLRLGGSIGFLEGRLRDGAEQEVARATATARLLQAERALAAAPT